MSQSESIKELMTALLAAQMNINPAEESGVNTFFNNAKYSTLLDVMEAIDGPLHEHGIVYIQLTDEDQLAYGVRTILYHVESGEWIDSITLIPIIDRSAHKVGSALTYARRYALVSLCGVTSASEDDDASRAQNKIFSPNPDLQDYAEQLRERFTDEDIPGFMQLWDEMGDEQKTALYRGTVNKGTGYLHSSEKNAWRTAAEEFRSGQPD